VTLKAVLEAVTRERLYDLARVFGVRLGAARNGKDLRDEGCSAWRKVSVCPYTHDSSGGSFQHRHLVPCARTAGPKTWVTRINGSVRNW
jgi:hypothetical protein